MKKLELHLSPTLIAATLLFLLGSNVAFGQITVSLPTVSGQAGSTAQGAITVSSVTDSNVTAFQFKMYYNKNIVYLTGVNDVGTLSAGNSATVNADTADGILAVAWASATPMTGSGVLLNIDFQFRNPGTTSLNTSGASGQTFLFNAGTPLASVTNGSANTLQSGTTINVGLPSVSGVAGSDTIAPVSVGDLTGSSVTAFQFKVYYDKSIAYLTGVDITGSVVGSNSPTVNADTADGILSVAWASSSPLAGSGTLLNLMVHFRNAGSTTISTTGSSGQTFIFNAGNPAAVVADGKITTNPHASVTGAISTIQVNDSLVTAKNSFGNTLWQYVAPSSVLCNNVADIYGNGHKEVLIGTDQNSFGLVIMLDSTGQEEWQFQTGATGVYWPDSTFNVHVIKVADLEGNGQNEIIAWSQQSPWFPQRLCVLSPNGSLIGDYWNPGYGQMTDSTLVISDLNNEGVKEIIAGSYNNDLGGLNVLFLLEGDNISGQAPPYDGKGPQGTQVWYNDSIPAPVQSIQVTSDLNRDGWRDLKVSLSNDSTIYISGKTGQIITSTLSEGLVAYYPFDGNANDESGFGNDGTVNGATLTSDRFRNPNSAYLFDGVYDDIDCGNNISLQSSNVTASCWVKYGSTLPISNAAYTILNKAAKGSDGWAIFAGGYFVGAEPSHQGAWQGFYETDTLVPGKWHNVVFTYDSAMQTAQLYWDGTLENSEVFQMAPGTSADLEIGNGYNTLGSFGTTGFPGVIDDIRIYNRVLSNTEIISLYHQGGWPGSSFVKSKSLLVPKDFSLLQNYPNPFNPSTIISYQLPMSSHVTLEVYDALGREIRTLVDTRESAGTYSVSLDGSNLPSGVYFYHMQAGTYSATKKLLLLK